MLWFLALAGFSAAAVAAYRQLKRQDPDASDRLVEVLREVTGVVAIVTQAVITALETLGRPTRPYAAVSEPHGYSWRDFE